MMEPPKVQTFFSTTKYSLASKRHAITVSEGRSLTEDPRINLPNSYEHGLERHGESSYPNMNNNTQYPSEPFQSIPSRTSSYSQIGEYSNKVSEWKSSFEVWSKGTLGIRNNVYLHNNSIIIFSEENGANSPEKKIFGTRKFRFSSEYFETDFRRRNIGFNSTEVAQNALSRLGTVQHQESYRIC
jgi:hypothetical protein